MSPNMKLSLLAFVGAAAAIPQYNAGRHGHGHKHHFTPSAGHAYPTGGWGGYNSTSSPVAAGTGSPALPSSSASAGEQTTEIESTTTSTITRTVYLTQYPSSASDVVGVKAVTTEQGACGPATVYVTATNKVTITVSAGASSSSSSAAPVIPSSSEAPVVPSSSEAPVAPSSSAAPAVPVSSGYDASPSFVLASSTSTPVVESPSVAPPKSSSTPAPEEAAATTSSAVYSSAAPASSSAPASSAAASAPATPGYSGGKRGLAYRWDGAADCKSFDNSGKFGFAWNWESDTKGDIGSFSSKFIPTLRTMDNVGNWDTNVDAAVKAGSKVVFGFNEPDITGQANMGVDALCDAWKKYMNPIASKHPDVTIVAPSVSSSENKGQGLDYLTTWASQCKDAIFHDVNIHWYGPFSAGSAAFIEHYKKASAAFPGKNLWVSEFGLTGATPEQSASFLSEVMKFLDGESSCSGYSYFAVGNWDAAANLLGTATALSQTGKVYVS